MLTALVILGLITRAGKNPAWGKLLRSRGARGAMQHASSIANGIQRIPSITEFT